LKQRREIGLRIDIEIIPPEKSGGPIEASRIGLVISVFLEHSA
jgi:hypothetical protein